MQIAVAEVNDTLTLRDKVKSDTFLKLLNDHVIRLEQLSLHPLDNRLNDELFGLRHCALREWVRLDILLGNLHDRYSHLEIGLDHFEEDLN